MRLEYVVIGIGVVFAIAGVVIVADAVVPDRTPVAVERRRVPRPGRSRAGQAVLGAGTLCIATALMAGEGWDYGHLAMWLAAVLVAVGVFINRGYIRGLALGPRMAALAPRAAGDRERVAHPHAPQGP